MPLILAAAERYIVVVGTVARSRFSNETKDKATARQGFCEVHQATICSQTGQHISVRQVELP
jgi:hypothetical protein